MEWQQAPQFFAGHPPPSLCWLIAAMTAILYREPWKRAGQSFHNICKQCFLGAQHHLISNPFNLTDHLQSLKLRIKFMFPGAMQECNFLPIHHSAVFRSQLFSSSFVLAVYVQPSSYISCRSLLACLFLLSVLKEPDQLPMHVLC